MIEPWVLVKQWLADNALARLFLLISLGYLLGEVRWPGNFRLGVAAVLFVGLAFGAWSPQMALPPEVQTLGLVLFVYCLGLQAAPGFFQSLKRDGLQLNLALMAALLLAFGLCWLAIRFSGRPTVLLAGLFCGGLTSTAALGAATDTLTQAHASAAELNAAVVGYGVAYPFAVTFVLLLIQLRFGRGKGGLGGPDQVAKLTPALTLRVETIDEAGHPWRAEEVTRRTGLVLTRCQRPNRPLELVTDDTELPVATQVVVVGTPDQIRQGIMLLGRVSSVRLQDEMQGFEIHRYFVSNKNIVGRPLRELGIEKLGAVVSRLRRGDVDLPVTDDTVLQLGDRVRVISYRAKESAVRLFFGNSVTAITELGYFSFGVGILLGLALGYLPLPIPGLGGSVRLGVAGGPLVVALILGSLGRTGSMIWNLPLEVNCAVRNLGTLFFLAAVGVKAGSGLVATIQADGWFLIGLAISLVLAAHLALWALLHLFRRADLPTLFGAMSAMQTQAAALSFSAARVPNGPLNTAYAAVYPLATLAKIVLAQILLGLSR